MSHLFSIDDFQEILKADVIIFGGQAVNLWASVFENNAPELRDYLPYLSKDIDIFASIEIAEKLKVELRKNSWKCWPDKINIDLNPLVYRFTKDNKEIELLSNVPMLDSKDVVQYLVEVPFRNLENSLKTLSPLGLLRIKLQNVIKIDQRNRQDERHVKMLIPCTREYIRLRLEQLIQDNSYRKILNLCHDAIDAVTYLNGRTFKEEIGDSFSKLLPINSLQKIAEGDNAISKYLTVDLPQRYKKFEQNS